MNRCGRRIGGASDVSGTIQLFKLGSGVGRRCWRKAYRRRSRPVRGYIGRHKRQFHPRAYTLQPVCSIQAWEDMNGTARRVPSTFLRGASPQNQARGRFATGPRFYRSEVASQHSSRVPLVYERQFIGLLGADCRSGSIPSGLRSGDVSTQNVQG